MYSLTVNSNGDKDRLTSPLHTDLIKRKISAGTDQEAKEKWVVIWNFKVRRSFFMKLNSLKPIPQIKKST